MNNIKIGDFFRVEHKGEDKSWLGDFFICTAVKEERYVMGVLVSSRLNYGHQVFNLKDWDVFVADRNDVGLSLLRC